MSKISNIILLFFPFLIGCASQKMEMSRYYHERQSRRIAVLPFESSNPYISGMILSDYFTVQILRSMQGWDVIERKDLTQILQEQKLTLTGIIKQDKFSKLGSILGVDAVILGSVRTLETIQSVNGSISVTVKMIEVSTGKILWADNMKISHQTWSVCEISEVADKIMEKTAKLMVKRFEKGFVSGSFSSFSFRENFVNVREAKLTHKEKSDGNDQR